MSGICGWIANIDPPNQPEVILAQMSKGLPSIARSEKSEVAGHAGLLARATTSAQAVLADGGIMVAIDGQINWQHPDLELVARDRGSCRALLEAYRRFGKDFLAHITGSFSVAITEPDKQRLFLATDRFGSKPLAFLRQNNGTLIFASTVEAIRLHPDINARIDPQAIFNYIYFHEVPSPGTIYTGMHKLCPGEYLICSNGEVQVQSYWEPEFIDTSRDSVQALEARLRDHLIHAVERCLTDEPTACFLSGGLDSSTVVGMAARHNHRQSKNRIKAYTIGFEAAGYDEMHYARIAAKHFNVDLCEYYVTQQDIVDAMPILAAEYDEPFGNSSAVPTLMCARRARHDGITTMLAGDGGDELFGGNERYAKQRLFEAYHSIPKPLRTAIIEPIASIQPDLFPFGKIKSYVAQAKIPMPGRLETYNLLNRDALHSIFHTGFLDQVDASVPLQLQTQRYTSARSSSLVNKMLWLDWKFTLADNDLRKVTRGCEIAGLTVSYPMLDQELVDLSLCIPSKQKVMGQDLRYLYKNTLRGFLPDEIIGKVKQGFGLPFGVWLATSKPIQDFLYPQIDALGSRNIFQHSFLSKLLEANRSDHAAFYGNFVYVFAMLELWLQAHQH